MESTLSIEQHSVYAVAMEQETFGQMLQRGRGLRGINQRDFADLIGVEPGTMSRWENDKRTHPPAPDVFQKIRQELRLDEREMLRALGYLSDAEQETPVVDYQAERLKAIELILDLDDDQLEAVMKALTSLKRAHPVHPPRRAARQPSTVK